MRCAIVLAVWVALLGPAVAGPEILVVIADDPAFRTAVTDALAPAGMTIQIGSDPQPSISEIATASRAIAEREHAAATVWLLFADQGATVIAYDRSVDRVLIRSLPYAAPLDAARAAEAARVAGTMLRALRVVEEPRPPPPPPAVEPRVVVVAPPSPKQLAIDIDGGVRMRGPGATASPTGAIGLIWRPDRIGVALVGRLAQPADIDGMFAGTISDQSIAVLGRLPLTATARIGVVATAGIAVHRLALSGSVDGQTRNHTSFDPAPRVGILATYALNPAVGLGAGVSADLLLRRQAYEVGVAEVLVVPRTQLSFGVVLLARIL